MFKSIPKKVSHHIPGSIEVLRQFVISEQHYYVYTAALTRHNKLKKMISGLAQEYDRHANEITHHLIKMGIPARKLKAFAAHNPCDAQLSFGDNADCSEESVVLHLCLREHAIVTAYRDILNEPFLSGELRQVLRHQLNGIMYAYIRLKLLKGTFSPGSETHLHGIEYML